MNNLMALDKSMRSLDEDGRLHIEKTHISKANVCPYYGNEIPGWESLGLQGDKVYQLLRDPEELKNGADTFARLPILKEHVPISADELPADLIVGSIGSDVEFNAPYLDADICFWTSDAIAGIETGQVKELSCAYRYVPVMEPGEFEGVAYDGRMTEIRGNHLALVEVGRAGSDVVVADHNPFFKKDSDMKKNRKTVAKESLLALDAELPPEQLDKIIDALIGVEDNPVPYEAPATPAVDEGPAEKIKALLAGKVDDAVIEQIVAMCAAPAADEFPPKKEDEEPGMKKEEVKAAMDAMRLEFRELEQAKVDVRPSVGDVLGMDSAADVYAFALDHLKVDHKDVEGIPALRALYKVASKAKAEAPASMAHDSAGVAEQFPAASRFRIV